jgi:hypothetical protein
MEAPGVQFPALEQANRIERYWLRLLVGPPCTGVRVAELVGIRIDDEM